MKYVNFGNSGVKVSPIALGLGLRGQSDATEAEKLIRSSIDLGINLIDCANVYGLLDDRINSGSSEKILGKVLKSCRDDVVITTKVTSPTGILPNDRGSSRFHIMREVEKSLKRLNTDHIDVYILHSPDDSTPLEEIIRAMDDLVRAGKILYPGCSNYKAWQIYRALSIAEKSNSAPFITMQNSYSLIHRQLEEEHFSLAKHSGVGIMAYSPIGIGILSGTYDHKSKPDSESVWNKNARLKNIYSNVMNEQTIELIEMVRNIAEQHNATPAQISLSWVLSHPEISVAIPGPDNDEQMKESLGALDIKLTEKQLEDLNNKSKGLNLLGQF